MTHSSNNTDKSYAVRLLHFSGSTPSIRKEKNRNLCPCFTPSSSVISTKGDWDTCGLRLLLFYFFFKSGTKLVS